jgi:flagellar biosynthetic protein FliQ
MVSAPILAVVLIVGLVVSIFQAITQIHEATLSFVPKLIAAMLVFALAGPWMLSTLVDYIRRTIESIPSMGACTRLPHARDQPAFLRSPAGGLAVAHPVAVPARAGAVQRGAGVLAARFRCAPRSAWRS